jgi:hypothetical protein
LDGNTNWQIANHLLNSGMRLTLIHALTGVCSSRLRYLYKSKTGESAPPGRMPNQAQALIRNRKQALEAAMFINYYDMVSRRLGNSGGCRVMDAKVMAEAYDLYVGMTATPMDITAASCIIRDVADGRLTVRRCSGCGMIYVYAWANEALHTCPMC